MGRAVLTLPVGPELSEEYGKSLLCCDCWQLWGPGAAVSCELAYCGAVLYPAHAKQQQLAHEGSHPREMGLLSLFVKVSAVSEAPNGPFLRQTAAGPASQAQGVCQGTSHRWCHFLFATKPTRSAFPGI